ncbi:MAG: hypothetical protein M3Z04_19335 [Chloroflexota bacterium]|nr:hypothetical protein [Chloroflexota bacterium]
MAKLNYPYPELLDLLQIDYSPSEYDALRRGADFITLRYEAKKYTRYWAQLPQYMFAVCPICGIHFTEPADTYTLEAWGIPVLEWAHTLHPLPRNFIPLPWCSHFLGLQRFIQLHEQTPTELKRFLNASAEVPYLTPSYFAAGVPTYAVLHALPICRTEDNRFVPRYTVFALTYFTADEATVLTYHRSLDWINRAQNLEYYTTPDFDPPEPPTPANAARYDLAAWAARGQLGWLDYTDPVLPLRIGLGTPLPPLYEAIPGRRTPQDWDSKYPDQF